MLNQEPKNKNFDILKDIKEDIWGRELRHRPK